MENLTIKIATINENLKDNLQEFVFNCENQYKNQIKEIVSKVYLNKNIKFVLLAGPSSSGKTTTARIICENFAKVNIKAKPISLDDFFVNREDTPRWEDGKYNYESVDAIDWKLFDECMSNLLNNKKSKMPIYDFITGKKSLAYESTLEDNEIIVIEGLHSLNPIIDNFIPKDKCIKIYLAPQIEFINNSGKTILNGKEMRFFRRLIRDAFTRGTSPSQTLKVWPDVIKGETLYIDPFKDLCDYAINTVHLYEVGVYKSILKQLNLLDDKGLKVHLDKITEFDFVDKSVVPSDSLLTEFVH